MRLASHCPGLMPRAQITTHSPKREIGKSFSVIGFDRRRLRGVDSSAMMHTSLRHNQNESAGMSLMPRALGKALGCFVPLQVDAELSCNVELSCARTPIAASIAAVKSVVAYARAESDVSSAGLSPLIEYGAITTNGKHPSLSCAASCACLANGPRYIGRPLAIWPILRKPTQRSFEPADVDIGAQLERAQLLSIVQSSRADGG